MPEPSISFTYKLDLVYLDDSVARFNAVTAAMPLATEIEIPTENWRAMGKPGTIDVTTEARKE